MSSPVNPCHPFSSVEKYRKYLKVSVFSSESLHPTFNAMRPCLSVESSGPSGGFSCHLRDSIWAVLDLDSRDSLRLLYILPAQLLEQLVKSVQSDHLQSTPPFFRKANHANHTLGSSVVQLSNSSGCKHGCHLIQGKAVLNKQVDQHCINESGWAKLLICTSNSFTNIVWIQNGEEVASTAGDLAESASKDKR